MWGLEWGVELCEWSQNMVQGKKELLVETKIRGLKGKRKGQRQRGKEIRNAFCIENYIILSFICAWMVSRLIFVFSM